MSTTKTNNQKIEDIKTKIQQLQNKQKRIMNLQKEAERKARTRRLIERGAILESLISNPTDFTNDQIKVFLEKTVATDFARKILDGLTAQDEKPTADKTAWKVQTNGTSANGKSGETAQGTE